MAHVSNPRYSQPNGPVQEYQNCPIFVDGDDIENSARRTQSTRNGTSRSKSLYSCLGRHPKLSRRYGWKSGIMWGSILATMVLALNITLIVLASHKDRNNGIVTLYAGSQESVFQMNLGLHILINICSTLLLSASNYGMQVLCSPTRSDCDQAHRDNKSLDIGVLSISNLRYVSWVRKLSWIALAISSVPLHLFYNGSIYQVEPVLEHAVRWIESGSAEWSVLMEKTNNGTIKRLTMPEVKTMYGDQKGYGWLDVSLPIDKVVVSYREPYSKNLPWAWSQYTNRKFTNISLTMSKSNQNHTIDVLKAYPEVPTDLRRTTRDINNWVELFDQDGWMKKVVSGYPIETIGGTIEPITQDRGSYTFEPINAALGNYTIVPWETKPADMATLNSSNQRVRVDTAWPKEYHGHVDRAFAQPAMVETSKISLNFPLILVVAISNAVKAAVLLLLLFDNRSEPPLVTIGDAICSFLERPDVYTAKHRNITQEGYLRSHGHLKGGPTSEKSTTPQDHLRDRIQWTDLSRSRSKWFPGYGWVILVTYFTIMLGGCITLIYIGKFEGWGTASQSRFRFSNAVDGSNAIGLSTLVNAPQLVLSMLYMAGNRICTKWAASQEYNAFGICMKPLRVSKPEGLQRGTRFLQLPFRWAIPMALTSGAMHWLLSQTIFLVRQDRLSKDGYWDRTGSVAACGVSGSAALVLCFFLVLAHLIIGYITRLEYKELVPFTGQYSWCISSACHPPECDVGTPLDAVAWGSCAKETFLDESHDGDSIDTGIAHYSFSTRANLGPTYRQIYTKTHVLWSELPKKRREYDILRETIIRFPEQKYAYQNPDQDPSWEALGPYRAWLMSTHPGHTRVPFPSNL